MFRLLHNNVSILSTLIATLSLSTAYAQSPADDFARRQAEQQKKQQIETLRKFTPRGQDAAVID